MLELGIFAHLFDSPALEHKLRFPADPDDPIPDPRSAIEDADHRDGRDGDMAVGRCDRWGRTCAGDVCAKSPKSQKENTSSD